MLSVVPVYGPTWTTPSFIAQFSGELWECDEFGPELTLCGTSLKEKQGEQETIIKITFK